MGLFILSQFWEPDVLPQCVSRLHSPRGSSGGLSCLFCLLVVPRIPWLATASLFLHRPSPLRVSLHVSSLKTTLLIGLAVVQLLRHVRLFATPWSAAFQASLSFTISWSLLKFMSIELVMPSYYPIICCPPLLLPSIFLSIRVFSSESVLLIRWP